MLTNVRKGIHALGSVITDGVSDMLEVLSELDLSRGLQYVIRSNVVQFRE